MADLIVFNSSSLMTVGDEPKRGLAMQDISEIKNGWFAVNDGKFSAIGSGEYDQSLVEEHTLIMDANNLLITPGLIDSHTHLVHGGSREHELEMKLKGMEYLDILKAGGGILSTVKQTRQASATELKKKACKSLNIMLKYGVTTVEAKSGYGLDLATELKQIAVAKELDQKHATDLVLTFMGAHAIPSEYQDNKAGYISLVKAMIDEVSREELVKFCDVFCEDAVFNVLEAREILSYAKQKGLELKIHADEIVDLGGAKLAVELGCISADHLMATKADNIVSLGASETVATILPATTFNLNKGYADARAMIDANCYVAVASDFNPGSCPSENLLFTMYLAANKLKMLPTEVLSAVTINAAKALGIADTVGSISIGKKADFVIFDTDNLNYLFYNFGHSHVLHVFKDGKWVIKNGQVNKDVKCGGCNGAN